MKKITALLSLIFCICVWFAPGVSWGQGVPGIAGNVDTGFGMPAGGLSTTGQPFSDDVMQVLNETIDAGQARKDPPLFIRILSQFMRFPNNREREGGCWMCPVFRTIYDVSNDLATELYKTLRGYFLSFLALFTAFWLLFHVLRFLVTLHGPNVGEFITTAFKTLGTVMIAAALLVPNPRFLVSYFIDVPAGFAMHISQEILKSGGFNTKVRTTSKYINQGSTETDVCQKDRYWYIDGEHDSARKAMQGMIDGEKAQKMAMSEDIKYEFLCLIKVVSYNLIEGIAMGVTFMAHSLAGIIIPRFSMLIIGFFLTVCYFYFFIRVPFFMIDLLLRICFLVIMLPIFIVCFPFSKLRGYSKTGWEMLLSVLLQMISLCIFISLALRLVEHAL